jgi:transposase
VGLPRSDFGKAVRYMLERWAGLTRFLDDPHIPLDNNAAERALRGPVVGRKNHYGSRSLRGTEVAAVFYTLCETARLVGVDPHAYLRRAVYAVLEQPGTVTYPEALIASTN